MPEIHSFEDQATLYVLGELTADERHEFEARMAQSAELRALVRQLEEGGVALAMASPRRRPPPALWTGIEKAVCAEAKDKIVSPAFWSVWWRHGWAAAAACVVGWLLYAWWVNRPANSTALPAMVASEPHSQRESSGAPSAKTERPTQMSQSDRGAILRLLQVSTQEIGALRWQVADLTNRVANLTQELTRKEAALSETDRIKFFQLISPAAGDAALTTGPISTNLQQALFLAMARELGWVPATAAASGESGNKQQDNSTGATATNQTRVDFVDLRAASNNVAQLASQSSPESSETPQPSSLVASASSNAVPGFISGTNAVLAFDSSLVPAGTALGFWSRTMNDHLYQFRGNAVLANNPMVVTVPFSSLDGSTMTITTRSVFGSASILWQFPLPSPGP